MVSLDAYRSQLAPYAPGLIHDDGVSTHTHFFQTAWIALVMLAVRYLAQKAFMPGLRRRVGGGAQAVFDNVYLLIWSCASEALAVYVTLYHNGGCQPWAPDACMTGWPSHPVHVLHKWYMLLMFQYYLHEMIGAVVGVCPRIRKDMIVHHVGIMSLIFIAYSINLNRFGIMGQGLFDSSNPFLHAAKALHSADIPQLARVKWVMFNVFAVVFFVARVAAAPYSVLWPSYSRGFEVLPHRWAAILVPLMAIMCGIQWLWLYKIIKMVTGPKEEGGKEVTQAKKKGE